MQNWLNTKFLITTFDQQLTIQSMARYQSGPCKIPFMNQSFLFDHQGVILPLILPLSTVCSIIKIVLCSERLPASLLPVMTKHTRQKKVHIWEDISKLHAGLSFLACQCWCLSISSIHSFYCNERGGGWDTLSFGWKFTVQPDLRWNDAFGYGLWLISRTSEFV